MTARRRRHQAHLGQALHHARAECHAARPRLPPVRSGESARPRRGYRHHARADAHRPSRRRDRPAASSRRRRVPQRPDPRARRVRSARLDHRRRGAGRAGLAHADGLPRRRPLDFAARDQRRLPPRRCCASSTAYARIRKQFNMPIGFMEGVEEPLARMVESAYELEAGARRHGLDGLGRREARRDLGAAEISSRTERARRASTTRWTSRAAGHLRRPVQLSSRPPIRWSRSASRWKAPIS